MEWDTAEKYKKKVAVDMNTLTKQILTILAIEHEMEYASVSAFTILKNYIDRYTRPLPYKEHGYAHFRDLIEDIPVIEEDKNFPNHYRLKRNYWKGVGKERLPKKVEKKNWDSNLKEIRKCREALAQWDDDEWIEWNKSVTPVMSQLESPTMSKVHAWLEDTTHEAHVVDEDWAFVSKAHSNSEASSSPFSHISKPGDTAKRNVIKAKVRNAW